MNDGRAMLADFGVASFVSENELFQNTKGTY